MNTIPLTIDGMHCGHCVAAVKQAIESVPGAELTDLRMGAATVRVQNDAQLQQVRSAIEDAGYFAEAGTS